MNQPRDNRPAPASGGLLPEYDRLRDMITRYHMASGQEALEETAQSLARAASRHLPAILDRLAELEATRPAPPAPPAQPAGVSADRIAVLERVLAAAERAYDFLPDCRTDCHGDKCRLPNCIACNGEDYAINPASVAQELAAAIAASKGNA